MSITNSPAVFFDIGDTLAKVIFTEEGDQIERFEVFDYVPDALQRLKDNGVRLGIISNRGGISEKNVKDALEAAGLLSFFESDLIIFGKKDSPTIFKKAMEKAGLAGERDKSVFVGENAQERQHASAHLRVADDPRRALDVLQGN